MLPCLHAIKGTVELCHSFMRQTLVGVAHLIMELFAMHVLGAAG